VKRQYRSPEFKRKVVEESLVAGASAARMARAYGVNANQVFKWRQLYRRGQLLAVKPRMPRLLAVRVAEAADAVPPLRSGASPAALSGTMQIELARGTVRIRGQADLEALRVALEGLTR
jgi:transposase